MQTNTSRLFIPFYKYSQSNNCPFQEGIHLTSTKIKQAEEGGMRGTRVKGREGKRKETEWREKREQRKTGGESQ